MYRVAYFFLLALLLQAGPVESATKGMVSPERRKFSTNLQMVWKTIENAGKHNSSATNALKHAIEEWKASVHQAHSITQAHYLGLVAARIDPLLSRNAQEVDLLKVASLLAEIAEQHDIALPAAQSPESHIGYTERGLDELVGKENGDRIRVLSIQQRHHRRIKVLKKEQRPREPLTVPILPKRELKLLTVSLERVSDLFLPHVMEFDLDEEGGDDADALEELRASQRVDNIRAEVTKALEQWRQNEGKSAEGQAVLDHFQKMLSFPGNNRRKEMSDKILQETAKQLDVRRKEAGAAWTKRQLEETSAKLTRKNVHDLVRTLLWPVASTVHLKAMENEITGTGAATGQQWNAVYLARAAAATLYGRSWKPEDRALVEALARTPTDPKYGPDALAAVVTRALTLTQ